MTAPAPDEICELAAEAAKLLAVWDEAPVGECSQQIHAAYAAAASVRFTRGLIKAADFIQQQQATIERLSAALECLCFAVHGLIVATDGCEELRDKRQAALDAMKNAVAALGKDVSKK